MKMEKVGFSKKSRDQFWNRKGTENEILRFWCISKWNANAITWQNHLSNGFLGIITSRTCSHTEIRSFRIWKLEFFMEGIWIQPYRKCCSCHPRRRSNRLGVGHVVRWDQWKQGNRRHGHRNHERLQIVVVHLAARHSRQKCYRLRHRDILTNLLDYHSSYMMVYPPKMRIYQGFTEALGPNWSIGLKDSLYSSANDLGPSDSLG